MSDSLRISRVSSDFSIERILAEDDREKERRFDIRKFLPAVGKVENDKESVSNVEISVNSSSSVSRSRVECVDFGRNLNIERNELTWLQCTRYRPPKLPRKPNGKSGKRKPGAHPRIPFTTLQLQVLENKYKLSAYLSRRDVLQLSTTLRLPQNRVKIWFQNRRARDRRESGISGSNVITANDGSFLRNSQSSPTEKFASNSS